MKFYPASLINIMTQGLCNNKLMQQNFILKVAAIFLSDVDEENSCCTTEHGDDITGCDQCQHLRQTPVDKLTHSKETADQGQTVTSSRSTGHVSPFSEIDKPSAETARITSCGKNIGTQEQM